LGSWFGGGAAANPNANVVPEGGRNNARASIYVQNLGRGNTLRINVGQEVEAQYDDDQLWYRAKITKLESANKIQVAFTEYGNSQWCGIGQLRPLVDYVEGMHVQARYDEDEQWYPAKILRKTAPDTFLVVFTEYHNEQTCNRSILKPLDKEIKRMLKEESDRQTKAYGNAQIAAALEAEALKDEQEQQAKAKNKEPDEKESHPEDPVFQDKPNEDRFSNSDPKQWTALEDAALSQYVEKHRTDFDRDPRSGAFWRKAEKDITTVHRTWTQLKLRYLTDLISAQKSEPASSREAVRTPTASPKVQYKRKEKAENELICIFVLFQ
jgi:hypothetical protein